MRIAWFAGFLAIGCASSTSAPAGPDGGTGGTGHGHAPDGGGGGSGRTGAGGAGAGAGGAGAGGASEAIGWCKLQHPAQTRAVIGRPSEPVYGRVFARGRTPGDGRGAGITGQVGFGAVGSDPAAAMGWMWADATYNTDVDGAQPGDKSNDEYQAQLSAPAGGYDVAYRFSADGGASWRYCDTDGSDNGYSPAAAAKLEVGPPPPITIGWCNLQFPTMLRTEPGRATDAIYGRVFSDGLTGGVGRGEGITGQLGHGPMGSDPQSADWAWVPASFGADVDGFQTGDHANDEYQAMLTVATAGVYAFGYRFSGDGGQSWRYCDSDGSDNGFQRPGALVVAPAGMGGAGTGGAGAGGAGAGGAGRGGAGAGGAGAGAGGSGSGGTSMPPLPIGFCNVQYPAMTMAAPGALSEAIYGRVYVAGVTDRTGRGARVTGQLGVGPVGSDPQSSMLWNWIDASYNVDVDGLSPIANDEYVAQISRPVVGTFRYAYRFSTDAGASWSYCDTRFDNGFQIDETGVLEVR